MKPIFRSSMFGFHKGDVFNFITKQNKQYEAKIADLNEELEKTKADFDKERQAFERDTTELEVLRNSIEQMKQTVATVSASVAEILNDKAKILACADSLQNEQAEFESKFADMQRRANEAEKLRLKAEKFDQLSGALSGIFNQPQMMNEETQIQEDVEETTGFNCQTVPELVSLLEALSLHCEKMQSYLAEERADD